jgi:hypothetical protein
MPYAAPYTDPYADSYAAPHSAAPNYSAPYSDPYSDPYVGGSVPGDLSSEAPPPVYGGAQPQGYGELPDTGYGGEGTTGYPGDGSVEYTEGAGDLQNAAYSPNEPYPTGTASDMNGHAGTPAGNGTKGGVTDNSGSASAIPPETQPAPRTTPLNRRRRGYTPPPDGALGA